MLMGERESDWTPAKNREFVTQYPIERERMRGRKSESSVTKE